MNLLKNTLHNKSLLKLFDETILKIPIHEFHKTNIEGLKYLGKDYYMTIDHQYDAYLLTC